jgi:hypothetical protein
MLLPPLDFLGNFNHAAKEVALSWWWLHAHGLNAVQHAIVLHPGQPFRCRDT